MSHKRLPEQSIAEQAEEINRVNYSTLDFNITLREGDRRVGQFRDYLFPYA